jgi:aerobic-type carbon monoxide dehydrogenase small subunit (CoxS/CutS family)
MNRQVLRFTVNGEPHEVLVEPRRTLVDVLRDDLGLTGTHVGCEHGVCGACTVLLDGDAVRSCLILGVQAAGREVTTIEGVGRDGAPHPLQEAFRDCHSFQCGFCTPGFLMTAVALLRDGVPAGEEELREELAGNLCRCSGYQSIVEGVRLAAGRMAGQDRPGQDQARQAAEVAP